MVIVDKWNTAYPAELRDYIEPQEIIDSSPELVAAGNNITAGARTTDEAILSIHDYMKTKTGTGHVPIVLDVPVRKASDQLKACKLDPKRHNLCVQKTILEVGLLKSQGIPARVGVSMCGTHTSRLQFNPTLKTIIEMVPWLGKIPVVPHAFTEIYAYDANGEGKFRRKDAYVAEKHCKFFPGTCIADEKKQWMENRDVPDIQTSLNCIDIMSSTDFPKWFAAYLNISDIARNSMHFIDIIDPIEDE